MQIVKHGQTSFYLAPSLSQFDQLKPGRGPQTEIEKSSNEHMKFALAQKGLAYGPKQQGTADRLYRRRRLRAKLKILTVTPHDAPRVMIGFMNVSHIRKEQ